MDRTPDFEVFVPGIPRPQGSKTRNANGSMRESSKYVKEWRKAIAVAARAAHLNRVAMVGPMTLAVEFLFPRPLKGHTVRCTQKCRVGLGAGCHLCNGSGFRLSDTAPIYMTGKPDKDKLVRAVGDALVTAGVVIDDSLFVKDHESGCKRYANPGEHPGARIRVWRIE